MYWVAAACILLVLILVWAYMPKQEKMTPTYNFFFQDSLLDRANDYLYDKKGMTPADFALEQKLFTNQRVTPDA